MKKLFLILFSSLLVMSCDENEIGDFGSIENLDPNNTPEIIGLTKKGAAFANVAKDWSFKTHDLGAHWMYSWGNTLREEIPENVEFVPMFWGKGAVTDENINRIKQLVAEGKVKFILGFNEPDGATQANMTVDEALALWPRLEEIGVPIGSPATVNPNNAWMQEFMQRADEMGLRVDFVAVHIYDGPNVTAFINKLKQTRQAYNRPIWITEFAVADWNATSIDNNRFSQEEIMAYMTELLPALDQIDWIERYAWFDGRNAPLYTSALFDEDSNLTQVGQIYAGNKPNINIGPGVETQFVPEVDENEIIINGGFETGQIAPWGGFKNGVVGVATTEPHTGNFSGRVENGDGSLLYIADVEAGKSYTFKFFSKWLEPVSNSFTPTLRNDAGNVLLFRLDPVPMTTSWEETVFEFTVPEGVSKMRFVFFKGQGFPPFFLDDVSLKLNP